MKSTVIVCIELAVVASQQTMVSYLALDIGHSLIIYNGNMSTLGVVLTHLI